MTITKEYAKFPYLVLLKTTVKTSGTKLLHVDKK